MTIHSIKVTELAEQKIVFELLDRAMRFEGVIRFPEKLGEYYDARIKITETANSAFLRPNEVVFALLHPNNDFGVICQETNYREMRQRMDALQANIPPKRQTVQA